MYSRYIGSKYIFFNSLCEEYFHSKDRIYIQRRGETFTIITLYKLFITFEYYDWRKINQKDISKSF